MTKEQRVELFHSYLERKKEKGLTFNQTVTSKQTGVSRVTRAHMRFEMGVRDGMPDPRRSGNDFRRPRQ